MAAAYCSASRERRRGRGGGQLSTRYISISNGIGMTPFEIANLRQKKYNATVHRLIKIHSDLMILRVRPDFPLPAHKPGQYTLLGLGLWEPRMPGCQDEQMDISDEGRLARRAYSI